MGQNMNKLAELRRSRNYTQQQVADVLKTTQQAIASWERGHSEPDIQTLRDLAVIYGTGVEDLLGTNPLTDDGVTTVDLANRSGGDLVDGFWGHMGLQLPGSRESIWYPITCATSQRAMIGLATAREGAWLCLPTLNNRFLVLNPSSLLQVHLLDDACDAPAGDWALAWDGLGLPLEVYRGLQQYITEDDSFEETTSATFRQMITDLAAEHDHPEGAIERSTLLTRIHTRSGEVFEYQAQEEGLWDTVCNAQTEALPDIISLPELEAPSYRHYSTRLLCLIDAPLLRVMAGAEAEDRALIDEG
jgi:transcriptional regulator with XRE-family HTH domain